MAVVLGPLGVSGLFVGTLFLCERQGLVATPLALVLGEALILLPGMAGRFWRDGGRKGRLLFWAGSAVFVFCTALPAWWRPAALAIAYYFWSRGATGRLMRDLETAAIGLAFFAVFLPATDGFPQMVALERAWAAAISSTVGGMLARPLQASAGVLGFEAWVLFLCMVSALFIRRPEDRLRRKRRVILWTGSATAVPVIWAAVLAHLPGFPSPIQDQPPAAAEPIALLAAQVFSYPHLWGPFFVSLGLAALLGFTVFPARALMGAQSSDKPAGGSAGSSYSKAGGIAAMILSALLIGFAGGVVPWLEAPQAMPGGGRTERVVLYQKGYLNWLQPSFGRYGEYSQGMFGMLPGLLARMGMEAKVESTLTASTLANAAVLFISNPEKPLPAASHRAVWDFVARGGHLLVAGDHTWMHGGYGNPLNILIEPTQIRFRNDSANFFSGGWINGYRFPVNALTAGLRPDWNDPSLVVGASLDVGPAARGLIVGRWGFSDAPALGDSAGGYLGNLDYEPGERIGDLVLMATQRFKRGRVTVIGDTSPFFNGIAYSSYPFLHRLFLWAAANPAEPPYAVFLIDALIALVGGFWLARRYRQVARSAAAGALLVLILGSLGTRRQASWGAPFDPEAASSGVGIIDVAHLPSHPYGSWEDDRVFGLAANMTRFGLPTYFADGCDQAVLASSRVVVIIAPRRAPARGEVRRLMRWVREGGMLIIAAGAEEAGPLDELLAEIRLSLQPIPLGSVQAETSVGLVPTSEAWPVVAADGKKLEDEDVLMRWKDYAIAARRRMGAGSVVLIGDSYFFCNYNLEHDRHAHLPNVLFIGSILPGVDRSLLDSLRTDWRGLPQG